MEAGACSCSFDDADGLDCYEELERTARKDYVCCECGVTISAGDRYQYVEGVSEGQWWSWKTCLPCARIRRDFCAPFEHLREVLLDLLGFDYLA